MIILLWRRLIMILLNSDLVVDYKSNSQKARVMTEFWTWENIYCPNCGDQIFHYKNNKPVADFYCDNCKEDYELKSWLSLWNKITDWAYSTMIERLQCNQNPNFFFLNYSKSFEINNFVVIPKHYFTQDIVEQRKPLPITARRAGWVGCNILLSPIPESWKIYYIKNWLLSEKEKVLKDWKKTLFLKDDDIKSKWWIIDVMKCIETLNQKDFTLKELYRYEKILKDKYPNNNHVKDKIRQQLQLLRDKWYLEFVSNWKYRVL